MMPFPKTKVLVWVSLGVAACALAFYALVWSAFVRERARQESVRVVGQETARLRHRATSLAELLAETRAKRSRAEELFVGSDGVVGFLEEVTRAGARAGVETGVVKVSELPTQNEGGVAEVETLVVAVEVRGSFAEVYAFQALLEKLPRPLSLSRVSYVYEEEKREWSAVVEFSVLKLP